MSIPKWIEEGKKMGPNWWVDSLIIAWQALEDTKKEYDFFGGDPRVKLGNAKAIVTKAMKQIEDMKPSGFLKDASAVEE